MDASSGPLGFYRTSSYDSSDSPHSRRHSLNAKLQNKSMTFYDKPPFSTPDTSESNESRKAIKATDITNQSFNPQENSIQEPSTDPKPVKLTRTNKLKKIPPLLSKSDQTLPMPSNLVRSGSSGVSEIEIPKAPKSPDLDIRSLKSVTGSPELFHNNIKRKFINAFNQRGFNDLCVDKIIRENEETDLISRQGILLSELVSRLEICQIELNSFLAEKQQITKAVQIFHVILGDLIRMGKAQNITAIAGIYSKVLQEENGEEIKKLLFTAIGGKNHKQAQLLFETLEKWNQKNANSILKSLSKKDNIKSQICRIRYPWSKKITDKNIENINIDNVLRSFYSNGVIVVRQEDITVNDKEFTYSGDITNYFETLFNLLHSEGLFGPNVKKIDSRKLAEDLVNANSCGFPLLKWQTISSRIILTSFLQLIFPSLFLESIKLDVNKFKLIFDSNPLALDQSSGAAVQRIEMSIYPHQMNSQGEIQKGYANKQQPIMHLQTEWVGYLKNSKEENWEGYFQILDYQFTEHATEDLQMQILTALELGSGYRI